MKSGPKTGRFVKGLVVGALVGTAVGLLVAPQPGRQSRSSIRRKSGEYIGNLRGRFRRSRPVNGTVDHTETHAEVSS